MYVNSFVHCICPYILQSLLIMDPIMWRHMTISPSIVWTDRILLKYKTLSALYIDAGTARLISRWIAVLMFNLGQQSCTQSGCQRHLDGLDGQTILSAYEWCTVIATDTRLTRDLSSALFRNHWRSHRHKCCSRFINAFCTKWYGYLWRSVANYVQSAWFTFS